MYGIYGLRMSYKTKIRLAIIAAIVMWGAGCFLAGYGITSNKLKIVEAKLIEARAGTLNEVVDIIAKMKEEATYNEER